MSDSTVRAYADSIMRLIGADIASGLVPASVASFGELHDYVDANMYADDAGVPYVTGSDAELALINAVEGEVSRRLAAGELRK